MAGESGGDHLTLGGCAAYESGESSPSSCGKVHVYLLHSSVADRANGRELRPFMVLLMVE
jgi:hypothetical protein